MARHLVARVVEKLGVPGRDNEETRLSARRLQPAETRIVRFSTSSALACLPGCVYTCFMPIHRPGSHRVAVVVILIVRIHRPAIAAAMDEAAPAANHQITLRFAFEASLATYNRLSRHRLVLCLCTPP